jgi:ABC-2 type transport system ATP-binding protein
MKQRLGLAQAMVHDPRVLFLDEPTDGVDPVGRAHIRQVLLQLKGEGRTIFLNSHILGEVEQVCDRVAILEQGRLLRYGSVLELTRSEGVLLVSTVPAVEGELLERLRELAVAVNARGAELEVALRAEDDVDRVVDLLRSRGISIRLLQAKRQSLEDAFLLAVGDGNGESA